MDKENLTLASFGTPLTLELVRDAISFNGYVPVYLGEGWYQFKTQGDDYFVGYDGVNEVQFYKSFHLDLKDADLNIDVIRRAAEMINLAATIGKITFSLESDNVIQFRVYGLEKSFEHLCAAFGDYIDKLRTLMDVHVNEYGILMQEEKQKEKAVSVTFEEEVRQTEKVLS